MPPTHDISTDDASASSSSSSVESSLPVSPAPPDTTYLTSLDDGTQSSSHNNGGGGVVSINGGGAAGVGDGGAAIDAVDSISLDAMDVDPSPSPPSPPSPVPPASTGVSDSNGPDRHRGSSPSQPAPCAGGGEGATAAATDSPTPPTPPLDVPPVDKSDQPDAEARSMELKDKGNEALSIGHPLDAIRHYTDALAYAPTNAIILSNRAMAYIKMENYGLAIEDATRAVASDPTYAKGYYRRGTAEFALGRAKAARKEFKMVVKLKPKDRDARTRLAACDKAVKEKAFAAAIQSEQKARLSDTYDPNLIAVDGGYDGPHPGGGPAPMTDLELGKEDDLFRPGELPRDFVMAAIKRFKDQKLIHKRYVARLLLSSKRYFESLPSLLNISLPDTEPSSPGTHQAADTLGPRITVCGDTHGQFYDVLNIFDMNGYPSRDNPYLFNGDFVDRGSFSVEVVLTYLLFKMSDPACIYLLRGNHETKNMNRIYGFEGEVKAKYDDKIFELFLEVFGHLPLAAVLSERIFVTHGGLPVTPYITLEDIQRIPRGCEPPESGLMSDLLWSDPQPFPGKAPSKRGVGYSFGPDITESFLERNGLDVLVRSHEVKDEGYLVEHGGKTITVFSAPNYCDSMGNKGAFIHFDSSLEPKFTQYEAVPHPDVRPMAYAAGMGGLFM